MDPKVRMRLLEPNMHAHHRVVSLSFSVCAPIRRGIGGQRVFDHQLAPNKTIRPRRTSFLVQSEGEIIVDRLQIGGINQLVAPIDAYRMSLALDMKLRAKFLEEHGLTNASHEEIDEYLDANELEIPSCTRSQLPTINAAMFVRISGTATVDGNVMLHIIGDGIE